MENPGIYFRLSRSRVINPLCCTVVSSAPVIYIFCVYVCASLQWNQKSVFFDSFTTLVFETGSLTELESHWLARLTGQSALGSFLFLPTHIVISDGNIKRNIQRYILHVYIKALDNIRNNWAKVSIKKGCVQFR